MAAFAPMPRANVKATVIHRARARAKERSAIFKSWRNDMEGSFAADVLPFLEWHWARIRSPARRMEHLYRRKDLTVYVDINIEPCQDRLFLLRLRCGFAIIASVFTCSGQHVR